MFQTRLLISPVTLFSSVWLFSGILAAIDLYGFAPPYAQERILVFLFLNLFSFLSSYYFLCFLFPIGKIIVQDYPQKHYVSRRVNLIFLIWVSISFVEVLIAGGFPIVWIILGQSKTYAEFGISSIHGFANAMWLYLAFTVISSKSDPRYSSFVFKNKLLNNIASFFLMAWPFLVSSRALAMILVTQAVIFWLMGKRFFSVKILLRLLFSIVLVLFVFGFAGDLRSSEFSIYNSMGLEKTGALLEPLIWPYSYLTFPIYNLVSNFSIDDTGYSFFPIFSLWSLLPSVVRSLIGIPTGFDAYLGELVHPAFNVATAYLPAVFDWGLLGIFALNLLLAFVMFYEWKRYSLAECSASYSLVAAALLLTVFTNQFLSLPVLLYYFLIRLNIRSVV